ncbi:PAS domain-containing protein [Namhaeicola litoreus]|uniref:PAS domain S-box protein n=1 Tax=Namhaeicola litoreus TaxID=1052145 RepID=A0ABW3XWT0_9FLAO
MKISFEKKIVIGFVINILVVLVLGLIYWHRLANRETVTLDWIVLLLIVMSLIMLTVVYIIIKRQLKARRKSEINLVENRMLIQSIIDNTSLPISVKKINGEYLTINKQFAALFGLDEKNIIGKTDHDFLDKEIADEFRNADLEALKNGQEIKIEEVVEQDDGPHTYLSVKFPLFDTDNRVFAIGSIGTDITERKNIERSLIAGEKFFMLSMDILVVASDEKFVKINPALSKVLGYSSEELLNHPFSQYIHPDDLAKTEEEIKKLQQGVSTLNFINRWICKDGSIKSLSWTATSDIETGFLYAIARDMTEMLKQEQEEELALNQLYESQQQLALIVDNIGDGVIVANSDKQVVLANYMAHQLFGIQDDENIPAQFSDQFELYYPDEKTVFPSQNMPMERALAGEASNDVDVVLWHPELQQKRRVLISGRPIIDQENKVVAGVVTIKDIGEYKKIEEELKKSEKKLRKAIGFKKDDDEVSDNKEKK